MSKVIKLKLTVANEDKSVSISTHDINGKSLYKAQDLLKGIGYDNDKTNEIVRDWKRSESVAAAKENSPLESTTLKTRNFPAFKAALEAPFSDDEYVVVKGRSGGTYLSEDLVYMLAMYVSRSFYRSVVAAFKALVHGDTEKALAITGSVAEIHEIMLSKQPQREIAKMHEKYGFPRINQFVHEFLFIKASNNLNASKTDRVKLAESMRRYVDKFYNNLRGEAAAEARTDVVEARAMANDYRHRKYRQFTSFQYTKTKTQIRKAVSAHTEVMRTSYATLATFGV